MLVTTTSNNGECTKPPDHSTIEHSVPADPVLAVHDWPTNADLIADMARLGYLRKEWHTLDPTFGRGLWWSRWRPDDFVVNDRKLDPSFDFRSMPYDDASFDALTFDPPYVIKGGRSTSGMKEMDERYGQDDAPRTPEEGQAQIDAGVSEARRVLRPLGMLLVKCVDYVSSGKLFPGTYYTTAHAIAIGFQFVDRVEHVTGVKPQPPGRRQLHSRRNASTLLVFWSSR